MNQIEMISGSTNSSHCLDSVSQWHDHVLKRLVGQERYATALLQWDQAPTALTITELLSDPKGELEILGPSAYRVMRATRMEGVSETNTVTMGGPCLITAGDLRLLTPEITTNEIIDMINLRLPRLHQVIDAVGATNATKTIILIEDDLFANLLSRIRRVSTGREQLHSAMRDAGSRSVAMIQRWLGLACARNIDTVPVYTSDIKSELEDLASELTRMVGVPQIGGLDKTVIDATYTFLFRDLLISKGYVGPDEVLLCVEPFDHFSFTEYPSRPAARERALQIFAAENPYGQSASSQEKFTIAGFMPSFTGGGQDIRKLSHDRVINLSNSQRHIDNMRRSLVEVETTREHLRLHSNPIICLAANLLYWDRESRHQISTILHHADSYNSGASYGRTRPCSSQCHSKEVAEPLTLLLERIVEVIEYIGFLR